MSLRRVRSLVLLAALCMATACGASSSHDQPVVPPEPIGTEPATDRDAQAPNWSYHPPRMAPMFAGWPLARGAWLLAGESGERWRTEPVHPPRQTPISSWKRYADTTVFRAPERLIRIERWRQHWVFVGHSGTAYLSDSPLGPITSALAPPASLAALGAGRRGLVGVDQLGRPYRFAHSRWIAPATDDGCQARCQNCAATTGCRRLTDVAGVGGKLLALAVPEALLQSTDDGKHWSQLPMAPFGAHALRRATDGGLVIEGGAHSKHYDGGAIADAAPGAPNSTPTLSELSAVPPRRGPRALAVVEGRATVSGSHYYEALGLVGDDSAAGAAHERPSRLRAHKPGATTTWRLVAGQLGSPMRVSRLHLTAPCDRIRLTSAGDVLLVVCLRALKRNTKVALYRYRPQRKGGSPPPITSLRAPDGDIEALAFSDGGALVAGACVPHPLDAAGQHARATREEACDPHALLRVSADGKVSAVRTPELASLPSNLARSRDDRHVYFFGRRAKDGHVALFVSHDNGASFSPRPLSAPKSEPHQLRVDDDGPRAIFVGDQGEVGLVLDSSPTVYALADVDGRIEQVARFPRQMRAVGGHGRQILAASTDTSAPARAAALTLWESTDGGASFGRLVPPVELRRDELDQRLALACSRAGCIIGARLTRVGWTASSHAVARLAPQPAPDALVAEPALQPTIACDPVVNRGWDTVDKIYPPTLPGAGRAVRGDTAWSVLRHDADSGETSVLSVPLAASGKLRTQRLFNPVPTRRSFAYQVAPQMEGWAVARARLPTNKDSPTLKLEVAWVNMQTGTHGSASFPAPGLSTRRDVTPGAHPFLMLGLLSVSPAGLFVRPSLRQPLTLVFDPAGREIGRGDYPAWPATHAVRTHSDALLIGRRAFAVGMHAFQGDAAASVVSLAVLARSAGSAAPRPNFITFAPQPNPARYLETTWSYLGSQVGLVSYVIDVDRPEGYASFQRFTEIGDLARPWALPTQLDLPPRPRACRADERRNTPRLVAPYAPGTRHPVLVNLPDSQLTLLTDRAVLYGSPRAPCVAAWHANSLRGARPKRVAVLVGDSKQGWLLRENLHIKDALDYRPVRCRFAKDAAIPAAVWREAGTVRRR